MARRIAYLGEPVLTLAQVAQQCRLEPSDLQTELIEQVIIPGVTAQCEALTGAAIREARYEEDWPVHYHAGRSLDIGQAHTIERIERVHADGQLQALDDSHLLYQGMRESQLEFPGGRPPGRLRIRYRAGVDLDVHPGVRNWLLMNAATAFEYRETLVTGAQLQPLPSSFLDSLLADITLPPRF
ncbi:hypothetical protein [Pseudomonas sp. TUM22785]|uniref:hypothetical protein n=1 Tax=Pseudomonas sp. TUM22785 TaxID=3019098 RepID=UPI002305C42C|nr:hypothetical protein [Pseudomonas sp. TUM22785]WCD82991.1 hypothetical protein PI990_13485 [Pseudomonas sp. TUM22785]